MKETELITAVNKIGFKLKNIAPDPCSGRVVRLPL